MVVMRGNHVHSWIDMGNGTELCPVCDETRVFLAVSYNRHDAPAYDDELRPGPVGALVLTPAR